APPAWTRGCAATTGSSSSCCSGCATGSVSTWACPKTTTTSCWTTGATQRPGPPRVHYPERQGRPRTTPRVRDLVGPQRPLYRQRVLRLVHVDQHLVTVQDLPGQQRPGQLIAD